MLGPQVRKVRWINACSLQIAMDQKIEINSFIDELVDGPL